MPRHFVPRNDEFCGKFRDMEISEEDRKAMNDMVARQAESEKKSRNTAPAATSKQEEEVVPVEGGGGLLWNGQLVQPGALEGSFRNEAVQIPSGVPTELTRGRGPIRPEKAAEDLQYDRDKGKWFRVVGGKKVYE
ncbi:MAG: hypothetical protein UW41_C0016G0004 [Candidatus Collierbacteria bacterium GW2011_GWC2_44_18]|uniref:Uncharacterized protein n=2 Tax=Microgenomates group TaxID=1794810 RepID=A0A0G1J4T1_9BACT|nr:MAG: hypothetical protein UW16_C0041G0007 [Microgenomates group bacterium GW2011_GWC1_44_10]KKT48867.1 MAG: hypothetical protein UW41_C0016G0004 [Candidatus Collierbacteria bacterium GW2011_GWC2_44_18]KKT66290.1 MAG: hypothetical protein UW60_C0026G0006 [Candidatus Woesebacteria bacterium GW2011_GWA2_44_33]